MFEADRARIQQLGRPARSCLRIHDQLRSQPLTSIANLTSSTGLSPTTVASSLVRLAGLGVARETTGGKYGRLYVYQGQLDILAPQD